MHIKSKEWIVRNRKLGKTVSNVAIEVGAGFLIGGLISKLAWTIAEKKTK